MSGINSPGFPPGGLGLPPSGQLPGAMPGMPGMAGAPLPASGPSPKRKSPSRRVIGLRQTLAILLAVVAIAVFALASLGTDTADAWVLRAAGSVSELTEVTADMIVAEPIDARYVEEGTFAASDRGSLELQAATLVGQVTRFPIEKGQQLRASMFAGPGGALVPIGPEERLVSVPASLANAVAGGLRAGDRVDVVVVDRREGVAGILATDLEIVAVRIDADQLSNLSGEQLGPGGRELRPDQLQPFEPIPGMYTLRIAAELMPIIAAASAQGELHLFYRGAGAVDTALPAVALIEHLCRNTIFELRPQTCDRFIFDELDPFGTDPIDADPSDTGAFGVEPSGAETPPAGQG